MLNQVLQLDGVAYLAGHGDSIDMPFSAQFSWKKTLRPTLKFVMPSNLNLRTVNNIFGGGDLLNAIDIPVISTILDATADGLDLIEKAKGSALPGSFESCTFKVVPRNNVIEIGGFLRILQAHVEVKLKSPFTKAQKLEYLFISGNFSFPALPQYV